MKHIQQEYGKNITLIDKMCTSRKEIILSRSLADATTASKSTNISSSVQDNNLYIQVSSDDDHNDNANHENILRNNDKEISSLQYTKFNSTKEQEQKQMNKKLTNNMDDNINLESNENYYRVTPPKKRKIENFYHQNTTMFNEQIQKGDFQNNIKSINIKEIHEKDDDDDDDVDEIIEIQSVSSNNHNTRLKSNTESSTEYIVSVSSKSSPRQQQQQIRSRLKNTIPFDSFERCLNNIAKKYPEMTHEERVLSWQYSNDVSDIEDYNNDNEKFITKIADMPIQRKQQQQQQYQHYHYPPKIQIENRINNNNNTKEKGKKISNRKDFNIENDFMKTINLITNIDDNIKNKYHMDTKVTSDNVLCNNNSNEITTNQLMDNDSDDDNVLLTINTHTGEIYKNYKALMKVKNYSLPSSSIRNSTSFQKNNNLNPEIDKVQNQIIQTRAVYKQNDENGKGTNTMITINNSNEKGNFKIPNVPSKYSTPLVTTGTEITLFTISTAATSEPTTTTTPTTSSLGSIMAIKNNGATQKEEFYKYLGLETKSSNHQNHNINNNESENNLKRKNLKISSVGHFTRLQKEKITKLKFDNKSSNDHLNNNNNNKKLKRTKTTMKTRKNKSKNVNDIEISNKKNENHNNSNISLKSPQKVDTIGNSSQNQTEPKIKIVFSKSFASPVSFPLSSTSDRSFSGSLNEEEMMKPRRSCGCVINSKNNIQIPSKNHIEKLHNTNKKSLKSRSKSKSSKRNQSSTVISKTETIDTSISNSWIIMRHSYKENITLHDKEKYDKKKSQFSYDFSNIMPSYVMVNCDDDGSFKNHHYYKPEKLTLFEESKINSLAAEMYKKFIDMLEKNKNSPCKIRILMEGDGKERNNFEEEKEILSLTLQENKIDSNTCENKSSSLIISPLLDDASNSNSISLTCSKPLQSNDDDKTNRSQVQLKDNIDLQNVSVDDATATCSYQNFTINKIKNQQINDVVRKRIRKLNTLKLYSKLVKDKKFLKFLVKYNLKVKRRINGLRKQNRQKPKNNSKKISNSEDKSDNRMEVDKYDNEDCYINKETLMEIEEDQQAKTDIVVINKDKDNIIKEMDKAIDNDESKTNDNLSSIPPLPPPPSSSSPSSTTIQKGLANPLKSTNGKILYIYYEQNLLIVIQEFLISFWTYSKVTQMMAKTQEWTMVGECERATYDEEISTPFKNRLCISDKNPVYIELRGHEYVDDNYRECDLLSVYVNVYHYDEKKSSVVMHSVQLDTILGLAKHVVYTSIINSKYFVMCWKQQGELGTSYTGICKYALTPELDTLASIRQFRTMSHDIFYLDCITDENLIGVGQSQITIWNHYTGNVFRNFDLSISLGKYLGSVLMSVEGEDYLFLYQIRKNIKDKNQPSTSKDCDNTDSETPELNVLALTITNNQPKLRLIHSHQLPKTFSNIKSSICTEDYLIVTSNENENEILLLPYQPEQIYLIIQPQQKKHHDHQHYSTIFTNDDNIQRFYTRGNHNFIELTNEMLNVKPMHHYLLNFTTYNQKDERIRIIN